MPAAAMNRLRGEAVQHSSSSRFLDDRREWNLKVEIYLDCIAAQAVHSYRRDTAEPERSEGSIGASNFAAQNPENLTELLNAELAP